MDPRTRAFFGDGRLALADDRLVLAAEARAQTVDLFQCLDLARHTLDAHLAVHELEVVDGRLQFGRGDLEHPLARLRRGSLHGRPDRVHRLRATGRAACTAPRRCPRLTRGPDRGARCRRLRPPRRRIQRWCRSGRRRRSKPAACRPTRGGTALTTARSRRTSRPVPGRRLRRRQLGPAPGDRLPRPAPGSRRGRSAATDRHPARGRPGGPRSSCAARADPCRAFRPAHRPGSRMRTSPVAGPERGQAPVGVLCVTTSVAAMSRFGQR